AFGEQNRNRTRCLFLLSESVGHAGCEESPDSTSLVHRAVVIRASPATIRDHVQGSLRIEGIQDRTVYTQMVRNAVTRIEVGCAEARHSAKGRRKGRAGWKSRPILGRIRGVDRRGAGVLAHGWIYDTNAADIADCPGERQWPTIPAQVDYCA